LSESSASAGQQEPVLTVDFEKPLEEIGEPVGAVTRCPGIHGQALDTRDGGYLRIDEGSAAMTFDGPFSITLFARPEPWESRRWPVMLSKGAYLGNGCFIQLYRGQLRVGLGQQRTVDTPPLEPGRWAHLAVTYDGEELLLYRDGRVIAARMLDEPPGVTDEPLRIGAYRDPDNPEHFPFRGCIDELRFYNRALADDEVKALAKR